MKRSAADWTVYQVDDKRKIIFIVDQDLGRKSVTNDAENVIAEIFEINPTLTDYRVIYRDSDGQWDELVHKDGVFISFAPGRGLKPN